MDTVRAHPGFPLQWRKEWQVASVIVHTETASLAASGLCGLCGYHREPPPKLTRADPSTKQHTFVGRRKSGAGRRLS